MVIQPLLQTIGVSERLVKRKSPESNSPKVQNAMAHPGSGRPRGGVSAEQRDKELRRID